MVSPRAWLDKITADLLTCGLKNISSDPCVFISTRSTVKFYVTLYVDDMFIFYEDEADYQRVIAMCDCKYGEYTLDIGQSNQFTYLHMNLTFNDEEGSVYVDQRDYYESLLNIHYADQLIEYDLPHPSNLITCEDIEEDGTDEQKKHMLSDIMSLYWAARRSCLLFHI